MYLRCICTLPANIFVTMKTSFFHANADSKPKNNKLSGISFRAGHT
ncbi:hypothetical protein BTN50_0827 [Candidatus Enterovibrio altilux]|uniref:Uncharacterized protein n=1 Tax=Candidatus Enterovibrio altilux TaxID=1927128 RepID=A0A291B8J4_9GAMM|nr:hypothetical protein BTN50_0827 [Candidatus Enterovibrio luxaltus]